MKKVISKIKLRKDGYGGMTVTYTSTDVRDGMEFIDTYNVNYSRPVNEGLSNKLQDLSEYVMGILMLGEEAEVMVTGVSTKSDGFVIMSKVTVMGGKVVAMNTPFLKESDGYEDFMKVVGVINELYGEVREYTDKGKMMEMSQYVMKFDAGVVGDEPVEEMKAKARKYLEKQGAIVIMNEEEAPDHEAEVIEYEDHNGMVSVDSGAGAVRKVA